MKKISLYLFFILLLAFAVVGVKPVNTFITTDSGLLLTAPSYNAYPVNVNLELYVHVFNSSDGMQLWNKTGREVSCFNDVYYPNGSILLEQGGTWINKELKLSFNTSGVSTGIYSYEVRCNVSNAGGELFNYFELTEDGTTTEDKTRDSGTIILATIIGLSFLAFILLYFTFNLDDVHIILKVLNIFFSMIFMMMIPLTFIIDNKIWINIYKTYIGYFVVFLLYVFYLFFYWVYQKLTATVQETDK